MCIVGELSLKFKTYRYYKAVLIGVRTHSCKLVNNNGGRGGGTLAMGIRNSDACILRPVGRRFYIFFCLHATPVIVLKILLFLFALFN
jgi:hypothetical protein